jgi:hypothetical protein
LQITELVPSGDEQKRVEVIAGLLQYPNRHHCGDEDIGKNDVQPNPLFKVNRAKKAYHNAEYQQIDGDSPACKARCLPFFAQKTKPTAAAMNSIEAVATDPLALFGNPESR